ncbi:MAG: efflux RND transporter periplasmic adaptor subunit [Burkholderiales bacterium]
MSAGRITGWIVAGVALAGAGAGGGYWYAAMQAEMREYDRQAALPTPPGKKALYWHDPMFPQHKFDKPGKSPFMDMQLVPVYADDDGGGAPGVRISAAASQNLGMRTAAVRRASIGEAVDATGVVAFDEASIEVVQVRASGWIEKLHVRNPDEAVAAGAPLASIYSPEWLGAQEEYLALLRSGLPELATAARARLAYLGVPEAQIAALASDGRAQPRVTLSAPRAGVLLSLSAESGERMGAPAAMPNFAKEGMQVAPGMTLFRVAGLGSVWVLIDVPEAQGGALKPDAAVEVRVPAFADRVFRGRIAVLLPEVSAATRTLRARLQVDNPQGLLRPGMFARVSLSGSRREALVVPAEAVIATGVRKLVMIAGADGKFVQREVATGVDARLDGVEVTEIRRGLAVGDKVVVSGQFLIDSEASLKGAAAPGQPVVAASGPTDAAAKGATDKASGEHRGEARVEAVAGDRITLSHGPIASLKWPEMTMEFRAPEGALPAGIRPGARVEFSFRDAGGGAYRITRIAPLAGAGK